MNALLTVVLVVVLIGIAFGVWFRSAHRPTGRAAGEVGLHRAPAVNRHGLLEAGHPARQPSTAPRVAQRVGRPGRLVIHHVAQALAVVLVALIAIKVAASLATVSIGPIAALLGLVLIVMWFFDRHGFVK
jgi:hypothetical protein